MANKYRVDRVSSRRVPCGVNSIEYIGNDWNKAREVFHHTEVGIDEWGAPSERYGVILSVWNDEKRDYVIKCEKGLSR